MNEQINAVLDEIEEFLEDQQDVRDTSDGPAPNRAMSLLAELQEARRPVPATARKSIYIICAVRNATPERVRDIRAYADGLRAHGHKVHFPPDDAPQDDPTGVAICATHKAAMLSSDEVHIFWDVKSSGSHFDLGMAYALDKKIVPVACEHPDGPEKSYWKVMNAARAANST